MAVATSVDWAGARDELAATAPRLAELVRGIKRPDTPALGTWTVIELAAHLTHAYDGLRRLIQGEMESPLGELWELPAVTRSWVRDDAERDPRVLAERIEAGAARFIEDTADGGPNGRPWLVEGTDVSLCTFTCHLLNEAIVHGHDIARAEGRPWAIGRSAAAMVLLGYIMPVFQTLDGRTFVDQRRAAGVTACFDLRLRGGGRVFFVLDDGVCTVEPPSPRRVDCVVSADPASFLLVAWGRRSQWNAIARGQLMAWGRRPWMGLRFRGMLRNP